MLDWKGKEARKRKGGKTLSTSYRTFPRWHLPEAEADFGIDFGSIRGSEPKLLSENEKGKKKRLQVENVPFTKTTAIRGQKALGKVTNPGEKKGRGGVNEGCRVGWGKVNIWK